MPATRIIKVRPAGDGGGWEVSESEGRQNFETLEKAMSYACESKKVDSADIHVHDITGALIAME